MVNRSQRVEDVHRRFLVAVFFHQLPGPVVPAARLLVFEPQMARRAKGAKIVDHLLVVRKPLVDVQRPGVPFLGGAILPLVVPHLPDGKARVGYRLLVLAPVDDFKPPFQPFGRGCVLAPARGNQPVLMVHGRRARVRLTVGLLQQIVQQLAVEEVRPLQVHPFHRLHRIGAQQVLPELDCAVAFRLAGGVSDGIEQLPAQPAQLGEPFLHPVNLGQRLEEHLRVVPLPVLQGQSQRLRQVAFLRQNCRDPSILVLVQALHEIVGGVGVHPHELRLQLPYPVGGHLAPELSPQEPGQRRVDLVNAGGNRLQ